MYENVVYLLAVDGVADMADILRRMGHDDVDGRLSRPS